MAPRPVRRRILTPESMSAKEPAHFRRSASSVTHDDARAHSFAETALTIIRHPPPIAHSEAMSKLHDKLIGTVPSRIVEQASIALTSYEGRITEFNVASWLQVQGHAGLSVSLVVKYRDGQQQREAAVDHGRTDAVGKILLSGIARLPVKHRIEDLQVHLRPTTAVTAITIDELFVHPVEPVAADRKTAQA